MIYLTACSFYLAQSVKWEGGNMSRLHLARANTRLSARRL